MVETTKRLNRQQQVLEAKTLLIARAARRAFDRVQAAGLSDSFVQNLLNELKSESIRFQYQPSVENKYPSGVEAVVKCFGSVQIVVLRHAKDLTIHQRTLARSGRKNQESLLLVAYHPALAIKHITHEAN